MIRVTCADPEDQQKAFVMPCPVPINDKYGSEEQKFVEPDAFYQASRINGRVGITAALDEKSEETKAASLPSLTGCIPEKARLTRSIGLSQEQIDSVELENNLYEEYGVEGGAYTVGTDEETERRCIRSITIPVEIWAARCGL